MNYRKLFYTLKIGTFIYLTSGNVQLMAEGFSKKTVPSLTASKVRNMECRYFIELVGRNSKASVEQQLEPLVDTEVNTVVCCPMGWRFYNFPSEVDLTWKEPDKHPRNIELYPNWKKMVDNLQAGGDPLKDALEYTRKFKKRFVISFRMNDNHYVHFENFPTHNNFWRDHPEYRLGNASKPYSLSDSAKVFNYMVPEVRNFYFAVLEEICTKYDVDGVELDFQRGPRFFHDNEVDQGRKVMTAHIKRIREMLDRLGKTRGKHLELCIRAMHTVGENYRMGADILAWDAAGWLDGIIVSSHYIHSTDVGIEEFVTKRKKAQIYGELNYIYLQMPAPTRDQNIQISEIYHGKPVRREPDGASFLDRRYLTPETYRAATLSYLERGVDGVSFFNTYCVPQPQLNKLTNDLLRNYKDLNVLKQSEKNYTTYANNRTMFGKIFPARNENTFQVFVADEIPGYLKRAVIRFETKEPCENIRVEAWVNGIKLQEYRTDQTELFPPVMYNYASPEKENLKFFTVPLSAIKFGINEVEVKNVENNLKFCDFLSSELALYKEE